MSEIFAKLSNCRSCKAEILWIKVDGKIIPLNSKPEKRYVEVDFGSFKLCNTYITHFATCPDAAKFRKPGGKK